MAKKYYIYEGQPTSFPFSSGKKYSKFIADNGHLKGHEVSKSEYEAALAVVEDLNKMAQYKVLEYLHALMSQANHDRLGGKDLVEPLDKMVNHWLSLQ